MKPNPSHVVRQFQFSGDLLRVDPYGTGHIHDTYAAWFRDDRGEPHRYLLQRINQFVFRDPAGLMQNIAAVTRHLRSRIEAEGGDPERETLNLVPTLDGRAYHRSDEGVCWRAYEFIEGATTYDVAQSSEHVRNTAKAFSDFHARLADFPAAQLHETIPDFHNTPKRMEAFRRAVAQDVARRASDVQREIAFVEGRVHRSGELVDLLHDGTLPLRVTHNDTKINNVMIDDETGEGICVIDLDTVMPGLLLHDFGDAVRAAANTAAEDEPDASKAGIDLEAYEQLVCGFLDPTRSVWTPQELDQLAFSAWLVTLECGTRFLTDHLNGDVYFKVRREGHNLDRCRTQFGMIRDMEAKFDQMQGIVEAQR
jgi:hypothetical protein